MDAIDEERVRLSSRRGFLSGGVKLAGGGALALAGASVVGGRGLQLASAQDFTDDIDILNYALTLEHLEYAFYRDGLEGFTEDDFTEVYGEAKSDDEKTPQAGDINAASVQAALGEIRDHEKAHVAALTETITSLGGTPVEEATYDFGYDDLSGFLTVAQALENTGVAAYAGAAPFISDDAILAAALGIHSVEARHAAYLNLQNGDSAFPDAVDASLTRAEVLKIAGPFFTSGGPSAASTAAAGGAGATATTVAVATNETPAAAAPETPATEVETEVPGPVETEAPEATETAEPDETPTRGRETPDADETATVEVPTVAVPDVTATETPAG